MTDREVLNLLAHITTLDPRWKVQGEFEARLQVRAWNEVLKDLSYSWATQAVTRYYSTEQPFNRSITPGWIKDQWLETVRQAAPAGSERACNLARLCRCSHAPGVCIGGFVDHPPAQVEHRAGKTHAVVEPCPLCWDAKNAKRAEGGLAPVPYPTTSTGPVA
jgi:hypothetical protein